MSEFHKRRNLVLVAVSIILFYLAFFIIALGIGLILPVLLVPLLIIGFGLGVLANAIIIAILAFST